MYVLFILKDFSGCIVCSQIVLATLLGLAEAQLLVQIPLGIVPVIHLMDTLASNVMTVCLDST